MTNLPSGDNNSGQPATLGQWLQSHPAGAMMLASALLAVIAFFVWRRFFQPPKQKRKRMDQRRKPNPTLAQTGGLPPPRDPHRPAQPPHL